MVKQWRKTDMPCSASLPGDRRNGSGKGPLRRIGSFYLAILLLFLTSCIHLLHTCTPQWFCTLNSVSPSISGSGCFTDPRETPAGSPCLACLFLHALSATKVAVLSYALSWLIIFWNLLPYQCLLFSTNEASPCLIRGPPCGVAMS
jgi:hypothetical protein